MKVRACIRGEVSICLPKYGAIFLFLAVAVLIFVLRNMEVLEWFEVGGGQLEQAKEDSASKEILFQHKVNSTIIVPRVSTVPDMHHGFCTFQPLSPKDALEERLLLDSIAWPETPPLPAPLSLEQTSDPAHSTFTILPPGRGGGQWHVGDQLEVVIKMYDFQGHPKKSGGDFLLARLHNPTLGAGVVGHVVDHLNGSYSAVFSLLWEGSAQVQVTLVHPSEAVTVLRRLNSEQPDRIYFKSLFRSGSLSETTICNVCLRPTQQPLCNYTDLRTGEPWFCYKPKKLSCDARINHYMGGFKQNLKAKEEKLFQSAPEDLPSSSSSPDIRARPQRSQEERDSISTPDLDAERMGVDTHDAWKDILCPQAAATLFKRHLLRKKEVEPPIRASVDIREDQVSQSREILALYKSPQGDWVRPLHCTLQGDAAVGVGVQRHFLSLAMFKLQHGLNINSGMSDITLLFEGEQDHLLPSTSQILVESDLFVVAGRMIGHSFLHGGPLLHGVSEAIIHMLLHGDVDTATIYLADVADLDLQETIHMAILSQIVWPGDDSDDDDDEDDSYPLSIQDQTAGFLRKFIETGKFISGVNMKVSIRASGPASVTVLPKKEGQPEVESSSMKSGLSGYYYQGVWRALSGTTVHQFNTSAISQCLKGKVVHMYGDSTVRQWFEYLNAALPDLKEFNLHSPRKAGPYMALDYANNILVTSRFHGPPIRIVTVPTSEMRYIANELDGLIGGTSTVIVFGIWAHFGTFPIEIYIRRLQSIRRAVVRLLDRAPGTLVVIRTGNPKALTRTVALTNSDWYSLQCDKVLRAMFKGLNVRLVDAWEMTLAHHLPHNLHPQPPIIKNMINVILSYTCPQKGG